MEIKDLNNPIKVSIIVPTYNEEKDIERTLDSLISLRYKNKEILVVDESSDSTPDLVKRYSSKGIRYIRQTGPKGRCRARNQGILEASGEIVIILNADVCLPVDFIEKILPHYERGADFLLVQSQVANIDSLFPRYVEASHQVRYPVLMNMAWTEGFSCYRRAAIDVGLFEDSFPIPLLAGEDGLFGEKLERLYKKAADDTILVTHWVPETFKDFWAQRISRGVATPIFFKYVKKQEISVVIARAVFRSFIYLLGWVSLLPWLRFAWKLSQKSEKKIGDFAPFIFTIFLEYLGAILGEFKGIGILLKGAKNQKNSLITKTESKGTI